MNHYSYSDGKGRGQPNFSGCRHGANPENYLRTPGCKIYAGRMGAGA